MSRHQKALRICQRHWRCGQAGSARSAAHAAPLRRPGDEGDRFLVSPQYLFDIEAHQRVPAPHVIREWAGVLDLEYDTLVAITCAVDTAVRESLKAHPQHTEVAIKLFLTAQQREFHDWDHLLQHIDAGSTCGS